MRTIVRRTSRLAVTAYKDSRDTVRLGRWMVTHFARIGWESW